MIANYMAVKCIRRWVQRNCNLSSRRN